MWSRNLRNLPRRNYNESSAESSSYASPVNSGPPGTPLEGETNGLANLRAASDQLAADQTIQQAASILSNNMDAAEIARQQTLEFDQQDLQDGEKAIQTSANIRVEIDLEDIQFWFSELESEMHLASVNSQWLKLSVLRKNLPNKQREDVKSLLRLSKGQAGPIPYYNVKKALLKLYSLKPPDTFKKAMSRVLVGLPSQLGKQIIDDVCDKPNKLEGCCCAKAAFALWTLQLPVNICQHISTMEFTHDSYQKVFDAADKVFLSSKTVTSVAALQSQPPSGFSLAASATSPLNTAMYEKDSASGQIAALQTRPPKKNKNQKNNQNGQNKNNKNENQSQDKGQNKDQSQGQQRKGPRHSSLPPHQCCDNHFVHGAGAWFCQKPQTCPWKDRVTPKP